MDDQRNDRMASKVLRAVQAFVTISAIAYAIFIGVSKFNQMPPAIQIMEIWLAIFLGGLGGMALLSCVYLRLKKRRLQVWDGSFRYAASQAPLPNPPRRGEGTGTKK